MARTKQTIQNEVQQAANAPTQAQPNQAPQGPPPMVLQNPLPVQGLVESAPLPEPNPNAPGACPMAETGVHQLLALTTEEVNLQTRRTQYGTNTEPADTSTTSTSKTTNAPLQLPHLPRPPYAGLSTTPRLEFLLATSSWMIWSKHLPPCPLLRYSKLSQSS